MISGLLIYLGVVYAAIILLSHYGWKKTRIYHSNETSFKTQVSIIIPVRNEEINILPCLNAISRQSFPKDLFEVIVVDDQSEDKTSEFVKGWLAIPTINARIISTENGKGKKNALNFGISNSSGELIVTTDADCTMNENWLSTIVSYYEEYSPDMIAGMISLKEENIFLSVFQSLELTGLTAIGAAGIYFHHPLLCNGANLAYRKSAFESAGSYHPEKESVSGDDTMLMIRIANRNPHGVHFLKSKQATVSTSARSELREFFSQRKRWGSKVAGQKNTFSILIALAVVLFHGAIIASLILSALHIISWQVFFFLFLLKIIPEIILLKNALSFYGNKKSLLVILSSQIIYPIYLVIAAVLSQFGKYQWKERSVR
jgi:cellulose synthase/poly-beta-1,6-N-acetylglucosamine synthase-like glycosyltransferase